MKATIVTMVLALGVLPAACAPAAHQTQASPAAASPPAASAFSPAPAGRAATASPSIVTPSPAPSTPATAAPTSHRQSASLPLLPSPSPMPIAMLPPDSAPVIESLALSSTTMHAGDTVTGEVRTSSNVASVEARIGGYSIPLTKVGVGVFAFAGTVPNLPLVLHRSYDLDVIARNTHGDATMRSVPINIR